MRIQSVLQQISSLPLMINMYKEENWRGENREKWEKSRPSCAGFCVTETWRFLFIHGLSLKDRDRERTTSYQAAPDPHGLSSSWAPSKKPRPWSSGHSSRSTVSQLQTGSVSAGTLKRTCSVEYLGGPQLKVRLHWKDVAAAGNSGWLDIKRSSIAGLMSKISNRLVEQVSRLSVFVIALHKDIFQHENCRWTHLRPITRTNLMSQYPNESFVRLHASLFSPSRCQTGTFLTSTNSAL